MGNQIERRYIEIADLWVCWAGMSVGQIISGLLFDEWNIATNAIAWPAFFLSTAHFLWGKKE